MKTLLAIAFTAGLLWVEVWAIPPTEIQSDISALRRVLSDGIRSTDRAQLMIIPDKRHFDPPPSAKDFDFCASVIIAVSVKYGEELVIEILDRMLASQWKPVPGRCDGKTKWSITLRDKEYLSIIIDERMDAILTSERWYYVDKELISALTKEFCDIAIRSREGLRIEGPAKMVKP